MALNYRFLFPKGGRQSKGPVGFYSRWSHSFLFRKCNGPENVSYDKPSEEIAPARANVVVAEHGVNVLIMFHE